MRQVLVVLDRIKNNLHFSYCSIPCISTFFFTLFCIIWFIHFIMFSYFPIETANYIFLSVKHTPSLLMYQKYYFQYVSFPFYYVTSVGVYLVFLLNCQMSTSVTNEIHQHMRLFKHGVSLRIYYHGIVSQ